MITLSNGKYLYYKMEVDLNNPYIFYPLFIIGIILDVGIIYKIITICVPYYLNCNSEEDVFSKPRYSAKSSESVYPETTPFLSRTSTRISSSESSEEEYLPKLRESTTKSDSALAERTPPNLPYRVKTPSTFLRNIKLQTEQKIDSRPATNNTYKIALSTPGSTTLEDSTPAADIILAQTVGAWTLRELP
ncbi:hypothetical protein J6590_064366 [Homalodisca vitripennis]|nr:hypothetical protein J6590_064366 [Homalodisca vitripennis]